MVYIAYYVCITKYLNQYSGFYNNIILPASAKAAPENCCRCVTVGVVSDKNILKLLCDTKHRPSSC